MSRPRLIAGSAPTVVHVPLPTINLPAWADAGFLRPLDQKIGAVDIAKKLRKEVGVAGGKPGQTAAGKVRLYVIGQGALGAAASETTKHDVAEAEKWNLPIVLIVLLAVFGSLAAAAMPMLLGACTVIVTMGVVRHAGGVTRARRPRQAAKRVLAHDRPASAIWRLTRWPVVGH